MTTWPTIAERELKRQEKSRQHAILGKHVPLFETGLKDDRKRRIFNKPVGCKICGKRLRRQNSNHGLMHLERIGPPYVKALIGSTVSTSWRFTVAESYLKELAQGGAR